MSFEHMNAPDGGWIDSLEGCQVETAIVAEVDEGEEPGKERLPLTPDFLNRREVGFHQLL